ncbi:MAG: glycosyltransferase family 4 protein [Elusimicrobiota bacterium]
MKIVIDCRMIASSGIGSYIVNIVPFIINKFKVYLLGDREKIRKFLSVEDEKIIDFNTNIYTLTEQLLYPVKIYSCDIFWSPHYNIPLLPIKAKKLMVTIHDVYHLAFKNTLTLKQKLYADLMFYVATRKPDIILTDSNFSKKEIIKYTKTSKNIEVVYNAVDEKLFFSSDNVSKEDYILYVGNIKPHKNLIRALEAFSLIKNSKLKFKIVGKYENFITFDKKAIEKINNNSERVELTGYVDNDKLRYLYQKAKLLLFPSLYEGFGLPPLEAMACGCPCVVSNVASLPEVCGDAAYYVDPYSVENIAEGIEKVLADESLRQDLIRKGFENIKRFSWEKSANKIIEIIESLK